MGKSRLLRSPPPTPRSADQPSKDHLAAERFAASKLAAGLGAALINRAEACIRIEGYAGSVALLVHATHTLPLDHHFLGHVVYKRSEFDHEVTAFSAAGAGGHIQENSGRHRFVPNCPNPRSGRHFVLENNANPKTRSVCRRRRAVRFPICSTSRRSDANGSYENPSPWITSSEPQLLRSNPKSRKASASSSRQQRSPWRSATWSCCPRFFRTSSAIL